MVDLEAKFRLGVGTPRLGNGELSFGWRGSVRLLCCMCKGVKKFGCNLQPIVAVRRVGAAASILSLWLELR